MLDEEYELLHDLTLVTQENSQQNSEENTKTNQNNLKDNSQANYHAKSQQISEENVAGNNLRRLLLKETTGRVLLEKAEKGQTLSPHDRAYIVKLVVETELISELVSEYDDD